MVITAFTLQTQKADFTAFLKNKLDIFLTKYPEETVYLQTDKSFYKQNEYIWFNAFLLNSTTHEPSRISDVVYVELFDPKGNIIQKGELFVLNGVANGDFKLDYNAAGGIYTLAAYTKWMKNFGEECIFKKELTVQKVITPRLLIKLDFEKKAYGPNDEVVAILNVTDLDNQKVVNGTINTTIKIDGNEITKFNAKTDNEGIAKLTFRLPTSLSTTDGLLQAVITDRGLEESISRSIPIVLNNINMQFFPEGGDLCENVTSRVAFEALNEFGKGADVSGEIIDENNTIVAHFESFHQGMGSFEFTPVKGKTYSAKITRPTGINILVPLPKAMEAAYVLNIKKQEKDKITWTIHAPEENQITFTAQVHGKLVDNRTVSLRKGMNTIESSLKDFPTGIAVFTLFDKENNPVCERLTFVNKDKVLNIKLDLNKNTYEPKEYVKLDITTSDKDGNPVPANLSLSVVDKQLLSFADEKQDNILTYMLLSSELKGKIHEPSFYFDEKEKKAPEAIDYLMLTHGWRRFSWDDVLNPSLNLTEGAEKLSDVYGYVTRKGKPVQAEVYLIEQGSKRRIAKLKTTTKGQFVFHNVDISGNILLATQQPNQVNLFNAKPIQTNEDGFYYLSNAEFEKAVVIESVVEESVVNIKQQDYSYVQNKRSSDIKLSSDESVLEESVVIGYGTEKRKDMVSAAMSVSVTREYYRVIPPDFESILSGSIAGVSMQEQNADPGKRSYNNFTYKGINSQATGTTYPVMILDGMSLNDLSNANFSNWELINVNNINYITLQGPSSVNNYGTIASNNGSIDVSSKKSASFRSGNKYSKYQGVYIPRREFYRATEFKSNTNDSNERTNFNTTVYWNGNITTDKDGKATITFRNNDATSAFCVTAEGITSNGLVGRQEKDYSTQLPISADAKIPLFMSVNDSVSIPVLLRNTTENDRPVKLSLTVLQKTLVSLRGKVETTSKEQAVYDVSAIVPKGETKTVYIPFVASNSVGIYDISILLESEDYKDRINQTISVYSIGYPKTVSISGNEPEKTSTFILNGVEGLITMEAVCYTNILNDLQGGAESIFRQPYGCFEQVSSSTFPNIFALQFMYANKKIDSNTEKKALEYIKDGYGKLAAYEVKGGGFEWYGGTPAHEVLSAYGLIEFYEMKKVYSGVNEEMMQRTLDFIISRKDKKGGFNQNSGRYGFSAAPKYVNNAYIVYALAEIGYKDISLEYESCLKEAWTSRDAYRLALMANAAYSLGKRNDYDELTSWFKNYAKTSDLPGLKIENSIVRSSGTPLLNETLAIWCLALMKNEETVDHSVLEKCVKVMTSSRSFGGFGGTQATSLCLQALTKYVQYIGANAQNIGDKRFGISLNGQSVMNEIILPNQDFKRTIINPPTSQYGYKNGTNTISILTNLKNAYSVNISWYSLTPESSNLCPLTLSTALQSKSVKMNETVRLSATLTNTKNEGQPMSMAIIGIPGGLSPQPWQLKEMKEKQIFDYYEIIDNNLVLYYRELGPKEVKRINLDLKADIPGKYIGAASSTYLYYSDAYKYWVKGCEVEITN